MIQCEYCSTTVADDENAYIEHLRDEHYEDLGRIDRRRVDSREAADGTRSPLTLGTVAVIGLLLLGGGYVLFAGGSGSQASSSSASASGVPTPHDLRSVHTHGSITVTITGERIDFSRDTYQLQDNYFHFEHGNGDRWHVHGKGVMLQYAMDYVRYSRNERDGHLSGDDLP